MWKIILLVILMAPFVFWQWTATLRIEKTILNKIHRETKTVLDTTVKS